MSWTSPNNNGSMRPLCVWPAPLFPCTQEILAYPTIPSWSHEAGPLLEHPLAVPGSIAPVNPLSGLEALLPALLLCLPGFGTSVTLFQVSPEMRTWKPVLVQIKKGHLVIIFGP